ncbi:helix-turn-helix transcriptional regulator [Paenibacillus abyssi]|uniref:Serine/threonine protein kinase n=1 Tax=Paenibacillus abyssi TaxID=1340531 RepID=A0A917D0T3_9BACL|nr:AAA family ATPase [Paenibacillus abyssi]GGG05856.1 serine/threonine protein kinase [Paenibacillus abyssi]
MRNSSLQLSSYLKGNKLTVNSFFALTIELTKKVGELHQNGIYAIPIRAGNIAYDTATGQAEIIDLSLQHSHAYMSPEQTGKMNRGVDHRSDLYLLGMLFYEMLAGHPPFQAGDVPDEWIYMHLAGSPKSLADCCPECPLPLSGIVMKLLSKSVDERYQSAQGLLFDLERCRSEWDGTGAVTPFSLGEYDQKSHFHLSQSLYGRENEMKKLLAAYDRVRAGSRELMMVVGRSGSGKTELIKGFRSLAGNEKGYFLTGKFEQMKKAIPYIPINQVLRELVRRVLTEDGQRIGLLREKLLEELGQSGAVITEVLPEAAYILGEQALPEAPPADDVVHRFHLLFRRFIHVFVDEEHPLVIFFDDLQWADQASVEFLNLLAGDKDNRSMLIIGAYRENDTQGFAKMREGLEKFKRESGSIVEELYIEPFNISEITDFLSDTLHETKARVLSLAEITFQKTAGNPFYVKQFIETIHRAGLLIFNPDQAQWEWEPGLIRKRESYTEVVELILDRINKLPIDTKNLLQMAGTIGNRFDITILSIVCGQDMRQTAQTLLPALQEGLILIDKENSSQYTFLHDKVHEAMYASMSDHQKKLYHLHIGRTLLDTWSSEEAKEHIFDIVYHLNLGRESITDRAEIMELARLNLQAGIKAKASIAYESALNFLNAGIDFMESRHVADPSLQFSLLLERPECEYFCGYVEQAETTIAELLELAANQLDRARVIRIKVEMYAYLKKKEALPIGLEAMRELGLHIPPRPTRISILWKLLRINYKLKSQMNGLHRLPESQDPYQEVLSDIAMAVASSAFIEDPEVAAVFFPGFVMHGLKHGQTEAFPFMLGTYAAILCLGFGNYRSASRLAEISYQLSENFDSPRLKCRIHFIFGLILQYRSSIEAADYFKKSVQYGLESGDMNYVGFSMALHVNCVAGNLNRLFDLCSGYYETASRYLDSLTMGHLRIIMQYTSALRGMTEERASFSDETFQEASLLQVTDVSLAQKKQLFYYYTCKIEVCYLLGFYEKALALAKESAIRTEPTYTPAFIHRQSIYQFLAAMALYPHAADKEKRHYRGSMKRLLRQMKKWARTSPQNALHLYCLMNAEMERLKGNDSKAAMLYDQAIQTAKAEGYLQYEALANELASRYYLSKGKQTIAKAYMLEGARKYNDWGAAEKVKALLESYPDFVSEKELAHLVEESFIPMESIAEAAAAKAYTMAPGILPKERESNEILLARTMSTMEENASGLSEQVLQSVMVNAGAERGCLLQEQDGKLFVEVGIDAGSRTNGTTDQQFSEAVIQYVMRTRESVILGEAAHSLFGSDPYIRKVRPRSILCMPLYYPGNRLGILYLENNQMADVFDVGRIEILDMMLSRMLYLQSLQSEVDMGKPNLAEKKLGTAASLLDPLTNRETEILQLMAQGLSNKEIAERFNLTEGTVKNYAYNIYGKLGVKRRVQAVTKARELQLLDESTLSKRMD